LHETLFLLESSVGRFHQLKQTIIVGQIFRMLLQNPHIRAYAFLIHSSLDNRCRFDQGHNQPFQFLLFLPAGFSQRTNNES